MNDALAVATGYDVIWGERISRSERALYAAGLLFGSGSVYRKGLGFAGDAGIMEYRAARKITRTHGGAIQAHHILEARHLKNWGRAAEIRAAPSVVLSKADHDMYTRRLRAELPYGRVYTPQEVLAGYRRVYFDQPDWLAGVEQWLR